MKNNRKCLLLIIAGFVLVGLVDRPEYYSFGENTSVQELSSVKDRAGFAPGGVPSYPPGAFLFLVDEEVQGFRILIKCVKDILLKSLVITCG